MKKKLMAMVITATLVITQCIIPFGFKTASAESTVFSVPEGAADGQLDMTLMGNTVTNLMGSDGDFEAGLVNWGNSGYITSSSDTAKYGKRSMKESYSAIGQDFDTHSNWTPIAGHIYYASAWANITAANNSPTFTLNMGIDSTWSYYSTFDCTKLNKWQFLSQRLTASNATPTRYTFAQTTVSASGTCYYDGAMLIDLTAAFGAGNEPTQSWCDSNITFVNGTQSVNALRIRSVGKNLVRNGNGEEGVKYWKIRTNSPLFTLENGKFKVTAQGYTDIYQSIKVKPNTFYYFSSHATGTGDVIIWGQSGGQMTDSNMAFNTGTNSEVLVIIRTYESTVSPVYYDNIILVEGKTAPTSYESYKESSTYLPSNISLNSIGNVKDEVNIKTGQFIDRVGSIYLDGSLNWGFNTNFTGYKRLFVTGLFDNYQGSSQNIVSSVTKYSGQQITKITDWGSIGLDTFMSGDGMTTNPLYMMISNSDSGWTYEMMPTSAEIKAYFYGWKMCASDGSIYASGTKYWKHITDGAGLTSTLPTSGYTGYTPYKLLYKLLTPVTTKLNIPPVTYYFGGTVYTDNAVKDTASYNNGITINQNLPIKQVESVYKIDGSNMTLVDPAKVTVSSNGLSFTITGATNGEQYQYIYNYESYFSAAPTIKLNAPIVSLQAASTENSVSVTGSAIAGSGLAGNPYHFKIGTFDSGWGDAKSQYQSNLPPNTLYPITFEVKDNSGKVSTYTKNIHTKASAPSLTVDALQTYAVFTVTDTNPDGTQYQITCDNKYVSQSGTLTSIPTWITLQDKKIKVTGLTAGKTYNYTVKARNGDGVETVVSIPQIVQKPSTDVIGMQGVKKIVGSTYHTLILKDDGTVWAYGYNANFQLGDGTKLSRGAPVKVKGLTGITDIAVSSYASYAVQNDGTLWAWGDNCFGQLGDGTYTGQRIPQKITSISNVKSISAGFNFVIALKNDGTVWSWGNNDYGQLGINSNVRSNTPVQIPELNNISRISTGLHYSVALKNDNTVWVWGYNGSGQLGDGTFSNRLSPYQIQSLSDITSVSCGYNHTLALKSDGTVWAWGDNSWWQLGDGKTIGKITPTQIQGLSGVSSIFTGAYQSFVVKTDGSFWSWGYNNYGQLCDGTTNSKSVPTIVTNVTNVKAVGLGEWNTTLLFNDNRILTYGLNSFGKLGQGEEMKSNIFKPVADLDGIISISSGISHATALKKDGTVWTWGENFNAQLGDASVYYRNKAQKVSGISDVKSIASGFFHNVVLKSDGTVWTWGNNGSGQLGDATNTNYSSPVQVKNLSGATEVAAGSYHSIALKSDGTVWAWGSNNSGQLGNGTTTNSAVPVQVQGLTEVKAIRANNEFNVVLKDDGTVWAWGNNTFGQLGDGTNINKISPVQVNGLYNITSISLGAWSLIALKSDGTLWECGYNAYGQLGDGTNVNKNRPIQNSLISNVTTISCSSYTTFAIKTDGSLWTWGLGEFGQMGDGRYANRNTPFRLSGLGSTKMFCGGNYYFVFALKTDGTVLSSGSDDAFLLGNGNRLLYSTTGLPIKGGQTDNIKTTTSSRSTTLTWDAADGAESYDIEVDGKITYGVQSPYTVNNLNPNITHQFRVRSKNALVTGDWSQPVIVSKGPAAPAGIDAEPGRGSVTLTWNTVKGATGYDVEVDGNVIADAESPYKDIQNGAITVHKYRVRSKSANGIGDWSPYVIESPLPPLPQPPADITLTSTGTTVKMSWYSGADATGYDIESDNELIGSCKAVSGSSISYTQKGLSPLTSHTYRIRAKNAAGIGDWSPTYTAATTDISITTAPAISVKEENISDTYAIVNWNEVLDASGYDIVETGSTTDGAIIDNGNVTVCRLQGLAPGSTHTYKVRAKNGTITGPWSNPVAITTSILATPENIKADKYDTSIKLKWDPVPGASGYELKLNGTSISIADTTYSAIGLTPDTEYIYQVRAIGAGGNSGWSIEYKTKTLPVKPAAPANVKAAVSDTVITMTWDKVSEAVGYDVELNGVLLENDTATMYINSELKPNTKYTYRVRTRSSYMESDWSSYQTIRTLAGQPVAPTGIAVSSTQTSATISWAAAGGAIDYDLEIDDGKNPPAVIQHLTETSYTHRRLEPGTQYSYRLLTRNEEGISSWSGYIINNAIMTKCTKNNTVDLGLTAADVTDFTPYTMVVTYNTGVINVADLCTLTGQAELKAGRIEGTDITITEFTPGRIVFVVDKVINPGEAWTGVIESIKFKAKQTGGTTITYTVLCKPDEE